VYFGLPRWDWAACAPRCRPVCRRCCRARRYSRLAWWPTRDPNEADRHPCLSGGGDGAQPATVVGIVAAQVSATHALERLSDAFRSIVAPQNGFGTLLERAHVPAQLEQGVNRHRGVGFNGHGVARACGLGLAAPARAPGVLPGQVQPRLSGDPAREVAIAEHARQTARMKRF